MGLWAEPKQWFPTLHGSLQTGAELVMVKLQKLTAERFRLILGSSD